MERERKKDGGDTDNSPFPFGDKTKTEASNADGPQQSHRTIPQLRAKCVRGACICIGAIDAGREAVRPRMLRLHSLTHRPKITSGR